MSNLILGFAANLYWQGEFTPTTLYAVPSANINETTLMSDPTERASRFQLTASGFFGYQQPWFESQVGLSVLIKGLYQNTRLKLDALGNQVEVAGKGWMPENVVLIPNLSLRLGMLNLPHLLAGIARGNYDPVYGSVWAGVRIPVMKEFNLTVGGTFYQATSVYVEPEIRLENFKLSVKAGSVLNYPTNLENTRVGLQEGLFLSAAAGFAW